MKTFTTFTHILAVGFASAAAFFISPAGTALVHQYPALAAIASLAGVVAVYFDPKVHP